jgi:hypothetical protein
MNVRRLVTPPVIELCEERVDAYHEVNEDDNQCEDGKEGFVLELDDADDEKEKDCDCQRPQEWNEKVSGSL